VLQSLSPANAPERRDSDGGFSLVEIMVALAIFLVASAAVLGLIMLSLGTVRANSDRVNAATIARAEVDALRTLQTQDIPLGETTRTVDTEAGEYTITRTVTWEPVGSSVNKCSSGALITEGSGYWRLNVSVTGGELDAPQDVDALIYPTDAVPSADTGTITVSVRNSLNQPVSDVGVTVRNTSGQYYVYTELPPAGCELFPGLKAGPDWTVTLTSNKYITENLNAETQIATVDALGNTPVSFIVEQARSIMFNATSDGYSAPDGVPFEFEPDTRDRAADTFSYPATVSGLWPDDYTAWLRPCLGASDNSTNAVKKTLEPADLKPDLEPMPMDLQGAKVQLVGRSGRNVTVTYSPDVFDPLDPTTSPCVGDTGEPVPPPTYDLGAWDGSRVKKLLLPAGVWTFESGSSTQKVRVPDVESTDVCSVPFSGLPPTSSANLVPSQVFGDFDQPLVDVDGNPILETELPAGSTTLVVDAWSGDAPTIGDLLIVNAGTEQEEVVAVETVSEDRLTVTIVPAAPNAPPVTEFAHPANAPIEISQQLEPRCSRQ
jgi:prepilin-type N-terminal cleavage/methylation domain-containing protein